MNLLEGTWEPALVQASNGSLAPTGRPWTARALGGGMTLFGGIMFRYRRVDFDARPYAAPDALDPQWPIRYDHLEPYYDQVERIVGVARAAGVDPTEPSGAPGPLPPCPYSPQGEVLRRAGLAAGRRPFPTPLAITSVPYRGRPACHRCGPCNEFPCPTGARADVVPLLLDPLVRAGEATVATGARAVRIHLSDRPGRAESVEWIDLSHHERRTTRARCVVLAANAVQSAALLLRSPGRWAPAGLGNGHDMVGRGLSFKVSGYVRGTVPAPEDSERATAGPFSTVAFSDHYLDPLAPGGLGGMVYEASPGPPRVCAGRMILRLHYLAGDQPMAANRVRLAADRDMLGVRKIVMEYRSHPLDGRRRDYLAARATELLRAAGVTDPCAEPSGYQRGSRHLHGGCRAGADPRTSVVDGDGRLHEADNVYVVDGGFFPFAGGVNPTLTIQANALRIAERIAAGLGARTAAAGHAPAPRTGGQGTPRDHSDQGENMERNTVRSAPPIQNHAAALARARAVTASEAWDLNQRFPIVMDSGSGVHVWDVQGKEYVDLTSCSGAAPLGIGHAPVLEAATEAMHRTGGILPGPLSMLRVELAERLMEIFPFARRAMFFRTGSCATTAAVRLARVHTGARTVLTSGYHGWHDWHLQDRPPLGLPGRDPESVEFGYDLDLLSDLLSGQRRVAAVVVTPEVNFFPEAYARELAGIVRRHGALLIVDEVMTGFRYAWQGYHTAAGIEPDLITISKGLANGFALSAVLGRRDVMKADEATYLGNTYQREVTPFAAALATLDAWDGGRALDRIYSVGQRLMSGLNEVFTATGVDAVALCHPSMFDVVFADDGQGTAFFQEMWRRGFLMQYGGRFMPSAAMKDEDVDAMMDAAYRAVSQLGLGQGTDGAVREARPAERDVASADRVARSADRAADQGADRVAKGADRAADHDADRAAGDRMVAAAVRFAGQHFAATQRIVERWFRLDGQAHSGASRASRPAAGANAGPAARMGGGGSVSPRFPFASDPVLLGGENRSGTTLLSVVLDSHPDLVVGPELDFIEPPNLGEHILAACDLLAAGDPRVLGPGTDTEDPYWYHGAHFVKQCLRFGVGPDELKSLVKASARQLGSDLSAFEDRCVLINEIGEFRRRAVGARRWGIKLQRKIQRVDDYAALWPRAHFIHIVRDGRDLAASHVKTVPSWGYRTAAQAAHGWMEVVARPHKVAPAGRYLEIRYEDLVSSPRETIGRMVRFLGLRWDDALMRHSEVQHSLLANPWGHPAADGVVKPLYANRAGRFRTDLTPGQVAEFEEIAKPELQRLGYLD